MQGSNLFWFRASAVTGFAVSSGCGGYGGGAGRGRNGVLLPEGHMPLEGAIIEPITVGSLAELHSLAPGAGGGLASSETTADAPTGGTVSSCALSLDCL